MTVTPDSLSDLTRRSVLRRAAAAGLLATPAAGLLAACGKDGGTGDNNVGEKTKENPFGVVKDKDLTVAFFDGGFGDEYPTISAATYKEKYGAEPAIEYSKTILTDYQPRFYEGSPPDLLNNSSPETIPAAPLVAGEQLTDLTEFLDSGSFDDPNVKIKDTLVAGTVESGLFNNKPYTLNYSYSIYGHWYNQVVFDQFGWTVPTTWDDFATLAEAAKKEKIAAYTFQGIHPWYIHNVISEWIYKVGGLEAMKAIDNLEPNAWKSDAVKAVADRLAEMVGKGWIQAGADGLDHTTTQQAVIDKKALFIWCGSWLEGEMAETIGDAKLRVCAPWSLTSADKAAYGTAHAQAGEGFVVPTRGKNPAGGLEFLRIMLSKASASKFVELTNSLPVVKGAADGLTLSSGLESASKVAAEAPEVITWFFNGWYQPLSDALFAQGTELMAGRITAAQFSDEMQKAADAVAADDEIEKQTRA